MKKILTYTLLGLLGLIVAGVAFMSFYLVDLRNDEAKKGKGEAYARQLLTQMAEAHGAAKWDSKAQYEVSFEDEFFGSLGENSRPFDSPNTQFTLAYEPGNPEGTLQLENGTLWGLEGGKSYIQGAGQSPEFVEDANIHFWIPTYQYFIEFPWRIQNATALAYAGKAEIDGIPCEGVLASWGTNEPQADIDQYLIWISEADHRVVKLAYTVREMFGFVAGAAYYKDYQNHDGLWLAHRFPVESNLVSDGWLHEMRMKEFRAERREVLVVSDE